MKSKKKDSMQIKRPSLKGMKNTKYLGHFAQDKYIQDGHNFSGNFPMFREPSQLEMMAPTNPFDATVERQRRMTQTGMTEESISQAQQQLERAQAEQARLDAEANRQLTTDTSAAGQRLENQLKGEARKRQRAGQSRVASAESAVRARKFIEEL